MFFEKMKRFAKKKTVIGVCSILAVTGTVIGIEKHKTTQPLQYVLAAVTRGTLIVSTTGSGQVSGQNQVDLKPTVSGAVTKILVKTGQQVTAGTPLFELDKKDALKAVRDVSLSVRDAQLSVESAQLSLKKQQQGADAVALLQAENSLKQAERQLETLKKGPDITDIQQAENELSLQRENAKISADGKTPQVVRDAYDDAVTVIKSTTQTFQQGLTDADTILGIDNTNLNDAYEHLLSVLDSSKLFQAQNAYTLAKPTLTTLKKQTDALQISNEDVHAIETALTLAEASSETIEPLLQKVQDVLANTVASASFSQSSLDGLRNTIQSDRAAITTKLATLTSQRQAIKKAQDTYTLALINVDKAQIALTKLKQGADANDLKNAEERVAEAQATLTKLKQGTDTLDIRNAENSLAQRRSSLAAALNRLADAKETLDHYTVRAPFDGIIAKLAVHETDQASPSTVLGTLLTEAKIAQISLNEVDVAKIHSGQKATLTFDAVPGLTIAGIVSDVDAIGTATQGVVNYTVKIAFVTQDERIKTGMSVSAAIITDMQADALLVPNAALHTQNGQTTVQVVPASSLPATQTQQATELPTTPETKTIEVGLTTTQESVVLSGLNEGDHIVVRTIDPNITTTQTINQSSLRIPGLTGGLGGGGNFGGTRATGR